MESEKDMIHSATIGDYTLETEDFMVFTLIKRPRASCGKPEYRGSVNIDGDIVGYWYCFDVKDGDTPVMVTPPPFAVLVARELVGELKAKAGKMRNYA